MRQFIQNTLFVGLLLTLSITKAAQSTCNEIRAGIDIGSGTTKMVIARVDSCTQTVVTILAPRPGKLIEVPVEYKDNIVEASDGRKIFRAEIVEEGLAALNGFKEIAFSHGAKKFSAVATSAFRQVTPSYAAELIAQIHEQIGIPVRVIKQSEEARLGFLAAIVKLGIPRSEALVWDIGGGSMQISYWDEASRRVAAYEGRFANNNMQKFVVEQLKKLPPGTDISPNPILTTAEKTNSNNHIMSAIRKAEYVSYSTSTAQHRAHFRTIPTVIGIGGVHFYSNCEVTAQDPGCEFTRMKLQADILSYADLSDEQLVIAGRASSIKYAPKRITAGALTVGFMKTFEFQRVRSLKVDMADGILIDPAYWL